MKKAILFIGGFLVILAVAGFGGVALDRLGFPIWCGTLWGVVVGYVGTTILLAVVK